MNKYLFSALVIDDNFDEIKDFIKVLNQNGIATYYLNFVKDDLENYLISNIRLIITDLLDDNNMSTLDSIVATFNTLSERNINNFLLIVWTKHKEKYEDFIKKLKKYCRRLNFISIPLNKEDFINFTESNPRFIKEKYQELSEEVKSYIENSLFKYFLQWEIVIGNKSYKVLNELIEKMENDDLKNLIATLTQEERENSLKLKELFKILNTILSDEITSVEIESIEENFDEADIDERLKARLNAVILFEKSPFKKINNGNIYLYKDFEAILKDKICYEQPDIKFSKDFYKHEPMERERYFYCNTLNKNYDSKSKLKRECKKFHKNRIIPILIDVTPSCDIANRKFTKSRLLFGFLYENELKCIRKAEYLYNPNFVFEYNNELYKIIFCLKDLISINPEYLQEVTPILRARKELTADIQQKIASHIARIGVFSLEEKR